MASSPHRSRRQSRSPGRSGSPWQKAATTPVIQTGWTINVAGGLPWVPADARLASYEKCVDHIGDAAALIEAVRHCYEHKVPVPEWVVDALELLLGEFINAMTIPAQRRRVRSGPVFTPWARNYVKAFGDLLIADHLETNRRVYGLTKKEALDEAACHFRGTWLSGTRDALEHRWKKARRLRHQGWFQRMITHWEYRAVSQFMDPPVLAGSPRSYWHIINADRHGDQRGTWRERPRLLSHLSLEQLERAAKATISSWGNKRA